MSHKKQLMRLVGESMIVGVKDTIKLISISVICCCAVFVCTLFLNFNMDIVNIKDQITSDSVMAFYNAQVSGGKVTSAITGGCLLATSVVMLLFYVKHYIDTHKKELGILKALGYSSLHIAKKFWIFGISVLIGTTIGFSGAFIMMPYFYNIQNEDKILPTYTIHFHPTLAFCLVLVPTILFSFLSIFYAYLKLKRPALELLREKLQDASKIKKQKESKDIECSFLEDMKKSTLRSRKILVFFMFFSSFCYSAMTQMSFSVKELSNIVMAIMMLVIGIVLACVTLFLAITTVIAGNTKTIAMMRTFGYQQKECCKAILGGYRPVAYIGFVIGTIYQYMLLKIMVSVVFKEIETIPDYNFNVTAMIISLILFIIIYELIMYCYTEKIKKISIKEIMIE